MRSMRVNNFLEAPRDLVPFAPRRRIQPRGVCGNTLMECGDDHESLVSATGSFFSESLKQENVLGLGVACGVFQVFAKLIKDEEHSRVAVTFCDGNAVPDCLQHLFGVWPTS